MIQGLSVGLVIPDLWQQEAIRALQQGKDVVVQAQTGSGKTYIFELFYPDLKEQAVFTVPTRALANDKLAEWRARCWDVGISTGDVAANLDARVVVATLETQRGRLLRGDGPGLLVPLAGEAAAAELLGALVRKKVPVTSFAPAVGDLEHTFLDLSEGNH